MSEQQKEAALVQAADQLSNPTIATREVLNQLWNVAFEQGQLAALDEMRDRLCVCMK